MADTHIHIHLNGEETKTATPGTPKKRSSRKVSSPTKPKRKVSAYHKRMGAELKRLKKKHPKAKSATLMKKAHKHARRK